MNIVSSLLILAAANTTYSSNLPVPKRFQGNPTERMEVLFVEPSEMDDACGNIYAPVLKFYACSWPKHNLMVLPNPCDFPEVKDPFSFARLACHEKAHFNGWHHEP